MTNNQQWSPGPWEVGAWYDSKAEPYMCVNNSRGMLVCTCEGDLDQQKANARLIAAAPELVEAVRAFRGYLIAQEHADPDHIPPRLLRRLEALFQPLLARVEGGGVDE